MRWVAPTEKDTDNETPEKCLSVAVDLLRVYGGDLASRVDDDILDGVGRI